MRAFSVLSIRPIRVTPPGNLAVDYYEGEYEFLMTLIANRPSAI